MSHRFLLTSCWAWSVAVIGAPTDRKEPLWSLMPLERPAVPTVKAASWPRNPIDAFVLAQLETNKLSPSGEAEAGELLRRVTLDLTGLLPELVELAAIERGGSSGKASDAAFEAAVDRLLSSPGHGERWARHWLDLARFAESEGFKSDELRPHAWRYRDYVIRALNDDRPYDRFLLEQIAGDELWPDDPEARVATAFNRHYPDESNARNLLQRRQEILNDITDTATQVFTGLTFGCARCHDHKYDPITQEDYYRVQAFFANVRAVDDFPMLQGEALRRHSERRAAWEETTAPLRAQMAAIEEPRRREIARDNFDKFPPEIQIAIAKPAQERTPIEWQMYYKAFHYMNPDTESVVGGLKEEAKKRWRALKDELGKFSDLDPGPMAVGSGIADAGREAPATYLLSGGVYDAHEREVEPNLPSAFTPVALGGGPLRIEPPAALDSTGRRTALARWLAGARNPLTARVMANRLWHYHFGRGIAGTPSDLGALGERPTHPELLDWLACELVDSGWSLKRIHRLIVTSSTYRQKAAGLEAAGVDPDNKLLGRFPTLRLEGEAIRDACLQAAGILSSKAGGPSITPELPEGMGAGGYTRWSVTRDAAERQRRSVYILVKRNLRYPLFEAFDMPDTHESCGRRSLTTTAPQALFLLNDKLVLDWAQAFANRLRRHAGAESPRQITLAYRIAYSRDPAAREVTEALEFLRRQTEITGSADRALDDFCHVILNSSELIYRS